MPSHGLHPEQLAAIEKRVVKRRWHRSAQNGRNKLIGGAAYVDVKTSRHEVQAHGVEAHGLNHLNAPDYAASFGLERYLADEMLPSIQLLIGDQYPVTSFAFSFGASNTVLDTIALEHVARVRVSPGSCPY